MGAIAAIPVILSLIVVYKKWYSGALATTLTELKILRKTNTQLEIEAKIRLDDLLAYREQINGLQLQITELRERVQRLVESDDKHS